MIFSYQTTLSNRLRALFNTCTREYALHRILICLNITDASNIDPLRLLELIIGRNNEN